MALELGSKNPTHNSRLVSYCVIVQSCLANHAENFIILEVVAKGR